MVDPCDFVATLRGCHPLEDTLDGPLGWHVVPYCAVEEPELYENEEDGTDSAQNPEPAVETHPVEEEGVACAGGEG